MSIILATALLLNLPSEAKKFRIPCWCAVSGRATWVIPKSGWNFWWISPLMAWISVVRRVGRETEGRERDWKERRMPAGNPFNPTVYISRQLAFRDCVGRGFGSSAKQQQLSPSLFSSQHYYYTSKLLFHLCQKEPVRSFILIYTTDTTTTP